MQLGWQGACVVHLVPWMQSAAPYKPGLMVQARSHSAQKAEAGGQKFKVCCGTSILKTRGELVS